MIDCSLPQQELTEYVKRLLQNHLPDGFYPSGELGAYVKRALDRVEHCFTRIHSKYYNSGSMVRFDHLNGDHFASFLYFLSNTAWRDGHDEGLATRLFYLNKILHGLDLFFSVEMPSVFLLVHPLGTVLGKAAYSDYLVVYQNCTVGATTDIYPRFGEGTILYSRSSVIGNCTVGANVVFGTNSSVVDRDVPENSVVVGQFPAHQFKVNRLTVRQRVFDPRGGHP